MIYLFLFLKLLFRRKYLKNLVIKATEKTPYIDFDLKHNILKIKGQSYPEDTFKFYTPILTWLNSYKKNLNKNSEILVKLEIIYFNSSTAKVLFDIFDMFEDIAKTGAKVTVSWLYDEEDETIKEYGEEFAEDFIYLSFNLVSSKFA